MQAFGTGIPWAGMLAGPAAWAISTQLNYALVDWQCRHQLPIIPFAALCLILLALVGLALSWRARKRQSDTERFVAMIGVLMAALFATVILMQGVASLILDECTR